MNKRAAVRVRCVFCNSLSHKMEKCNSSFNGNRKTLDDGWSFLMDTELPNFKILKLNELRYVAWNYASYEGAIHDWNEKTTQQYNRKFKFRPIDLTLSKTQLVNELARRWEGYQPVRDLHKNKPALTEEDDCPICLECTSPTYKWSNNIANWVKYDNRIITECKHSFCKKCWETHTERNRRYEYHTDRRHDYDFHRRTGRMCVSCPMCRHNIKV
jgi:hypothetical protein